MNKSVIWDMDGVLIDTGPLHYQAWVKTLNGYSVEFSETFFRTTFGMNNQGVLTALFNNPSPALVTELSDKKEALFRELIRGNAQLLPGVLGWLDRLSQLGYTQAIASSAPPANIESLLTELNIQHHFQAVVSGFDMPGKPDPTVFLLAANQLGTPPARCVVVEDATAGVTGALRAGMRCIAVTTTNPAHALSAANIVVKDLTYLPPDAFDQLLNQNQSSRNQ